MKKKLLLCLFVFVTIFTLTGCGSSDEKYDANGKHVKEIETIRKHATGTLSGKLTIGELLDQIIPDSKWTEYTDYSSDENEVAISCKGENKNTKETIELVFVTEPGKDSVRFEKAFVNDEEKGGYNYTDLLIEAYEELNSTK